MDEMPGLWMAVLRGILAHRRNYNPVFQFDFSYSKWIKEFHDRCPPGISLTDDPLSSLPKQRCAHAHFGRTLFDRHFKIVRHSHRQNRQVDFQPAR